MLRRLGRLATYSAYVAMYMLLATTVIASVAMVVDMAIIAY